MSVSPRRMILFFLVLFSGAGWAQTVREVQVENRGDAPVDGSAVRAFITLSAGDDFDPLRVMQDVHRLRDTQRYRQVETDIEVHADGAVTVVYGMSSKWKISRIRIFGADYLRPDRLRETLDISVGDWADESDLATGANRIRLAYVQRGYPEADVSAAFEETPVAGTVWIRIDVNEGFRGRVLSYRVEGHEALEESVLRRGLLQRRTRWYIPWHWGGWRAPRYDELRVEEDRYRLQRRYRDAGHLDVRILEPVVEVASGGRIHIRIPIEEGALYTVGEIAIEGVALYPLEDVRATLDLAPGDVASLSAIENAAEAIADYYGSRGHLGVFAEPRLIPRESATVDVGFRVTERPKARIRDVRFRGNMITRDRVLRREIAIHPGDEYNRGRVRTSERRLLNLGYFSRVQARMQPTDEPHEYDLHVEVEEQRMGQASFGVGFSSIDQVSGFFEISHGNFDLFAWPPVGDGQKIRVRGTAGTQRKDAEISFIEPFFFGKRLALGVDLFHRDRSYLSSDFDQRESGGQVSLTQQTGPFSRATLAYGLERIELRNLTSQAAPIFIEEAEEGARLKSAMTLTLSHDTRDQFRIPTRGHRASLSFQVAGGALQGDTDLYALNARAVQYFPLWLGHVLTIRGEAGVVERHGRSDRVPYFDRFFLGGADTIRAFRYRDVGPRDDNGDVIGGRSRALATVEYTVPVVSLIRAAAFYDVGMVWADAYSFDSNLNSGYGFGLRLDIPMMPLRFDYAWPLQADAFNDRSSGRFSFYIGYGL